DETEQPGTPPLPEPTPTLQEKLKGYTAFSEETPVAEPTKVWTIAFNANVQQTERSRVALFNHKCEAIEATISLPTKRPNDQLTIAPKQPYQVGDRIYVLLNNWADEDGNELDVPIYFDFFVQ